MFVRRRTSNLHLSSRLTLVAVGVSICRWGLEIVKLAETRQADVRDDIPSHRVMKQTPAHAYINMS